MFMYVCMYIYLYVFICTPPVIGFADWELFGAFVDYINNPFKFNGVCTCPLVNKSVVS